MDNKDRMYKHIEREAEAVFQRWKEDNRYMEEAIERFMAGGRAAHAAEIMDRSDQMRVVDGERVEIVHKPLSRQKTVDSEEIRLLREQNELLKKLLAKQELK